MPYTLVQHTGYTVGGKLAFKNAVEERSIPTKKLERVVRRAGGVIIRTYSEARDLAEKTNYPPGVKGIVPQAKGKFVVRKAYGDEPIYVPER